MNQTLILKNVIIFGKIAYLDEKDNIEKLKKKMCIISILKIKSDDEWDNLQSKLKEYAEIHETHGCENILQNEFNTKTNNST
jgi:hypothetical protein